MTNNEILKLATVTYNRECQNVPAEKESFILGFICAFEHMNKPKRMDIDWELVTIYSI